MKKEREFSEGGSEVFRYEEREEEWLPADTSDSEMERITAHFESIGLNPASVFHENQSDTVHVDIHLCDPTDSRPFYTLFTTGMSDLPMTVPEGAEEYTYSELMLCLPPDWILRGDEAAKEQHCWPQQLLQFLARMPHIYKTWLCYGHTIPNGNPPAPLADGLNFCGALIAPPLTIDADAFTIHADKGLIQIYAVIPIFEDEMNFKLKKGTDALLDKFDADNVSEVLDPTRTSSIKRRKLFGLF